MLFVWIMLYGLTFSLSKLPVPVWTASAAAAIYTAALLLWCRGNRRRIVGLCKPCIRRKVELLYFLPVLVLPLWQVIHGVFPGWMPGEILLVLSAVVVEEVFFRGFALTFLHRRFPRTGVLGAAILFALLHGANFLSGWDPGYVVLQILLAGVAGIYWGLLRLHFGSLLPCILAHGLINLTGSTLRPTKTGVAGICVGCLIMLATCIPLYKSLSVGGNS